MNQQLFAKLTGFSRDGGRPVDDERAGRFIRRQSPEDAHFMSVADVQKRTVTQQIKICRLESDGEVVFGVLGLPVPEEVPFGLAPVISTPGRFLPSILELGAGLSSEATPTQVYDALNSDFVGNSDGYDGHDLAAIQAFFRPIEFYQSNGDAEFHDDIDRVLGAFLVSSYLDGPLALETITTQTLTEAFEGGPSCMPYRNLAQGILSSSWESLFLEIYRCIEYLYSAKRVTALRDVLAAPLAAVELTRILERELRWRAREDEAIRGLFGQCTETSVRNLCQSLGVNEGDRTFTRLTELAADEVYALRNAIVHFRPADEKPGKTDEEWNAVIVALTTVAVHLYGELGPQYLNKPSMV